MVPGESGWEIQANFNTMLVNNGYALHGVEYADLNFHQADHGSGDYHVYAMFDSDHVQDGGTRLEGQYTHLNDRPHPLSASNDSSFDSINYWDESSWQNKSWTRSFCLTTSNNISTVWISCPGTYNPLQSDWAALFVGPGNWGDWRVAYNNFSAGHQFNISLTGDGSDLRLLVWTK
jgi:hypothetical protein